ncbi:TPA: hypothetical protein P0O11_004153 [Yersinia enterocolitica]|nr:hypothetical protein [Yersinia enterocolitica]
MTEEQFKEIIITRRESLKSMDTLAFVKNELECGRVSAEQLAIIALDAMGIKGELVDQVRESAAKKRKSFMEVICGYRNINPW